MKQFFEDLFLALGIALLLAAFFNAAGLMVTLINLLFFSTTSALLIGETVTKLLLTLSSIGLGMLCAVSIAKATKFKFMIIVICWILFVITVWSNWIYVPIFT